MTQETTRHTDPTAWRETLYLAAINCSHVITDDQIVLHRDPAKDGNALSQLADRLAAEAVPGGAAEQPSKPTDISERLREYADNPGYSHNDYADTMRAAAEEIERYYGGMLAWKQTAEKKDRDWAAPVAKAVPEGLSFDGYSDSDEHYGKTILDLVRSRLEVDPDDMEAGDVFYVSACWTQPQEWRVVFRNGGTVEVERTAPPVAAPTAQEVTQQAAKAETAEQVRELVEQLRNHHAREILDWDILLNAATMIESLATTTSTVSVPEAWVSVDERLPEKYCLAAYLTSRGKHRIIRAMYVRQYEIEATGDECDSETNDADDLEYIKAGWYECIDNWGDYSSVKVNEGEVTHWMPLPEAPRTTDKGEAA